MNPEIFTQNIVARFGPIPITMTMITSLLTTLVVLALGGGLGWAIVHRPEGRCAAAGRLLMGFLDDLVRDAAGRPSPGLVVFSASLFLFISTSAVLGQLPGIAAPTSDLAATNALAIVVFLAVPIVGIQSRGLWGYLKHYFLPNPVLFPLHVISELSRTLALALRLFGNMMSGHLVVSLIVALVGVIVPVPLMALDLLIGFLQAYIFTVLASVYIGAAFRVGEEGGHE
ncbi:MAG: F0F1 ATP synthase subunit A [Planctomycetes bacterium]|nr:F0F1 ATP synthase subunit A [Planctomycetota bacterium]